MADLDSLPGRLAQELDREVPFQLLALALCALFALLTHLLRRVPGQPVPAWTLRLVLVLVALQCLLLLVNIALVQGGTGQLARWLWHVDAEVNFPSILTALPVFLLGALCCFVARAAQGLAGVERAYWLATGAGLGFMALVEFDLLPKYLFPRVWYLPAGLLLVAATLMVMRLQTSRRRRALPAIFLAGLGIWALGALTIDMTRYNNSLSIMHALEETLELLGMLLALAALCAYASLVAPARDAQRVVTHTGRLVVAVLTGILLVHNYPRYQPTLAGPIAALTYPYHVRLQERLFARPLDAGIDGDSLVLTGWHYELPDPGAPASFRVWLHATRLPDYPFGIAVQLLDQANAGVIAAADKMSWDGRDMGKWRPGREFMRIQAVDLELPADAPAKRALSLSLSFWQYAGQSAIRPLPVTHSDRPLHGDSHIILDEFVLPGPPAPAGATDSLARFANGFRLHGATLPERAAAGAGATVTFTWGATTAGSEDFIQFLHFFHDDSESYWTVDQMPLGARLPTRLWYEGLLDSEAWHVALPAGLLPGRYSVYTGLYRQADLERLAATLADGRPAGDARVPLGSILID